MPLTVTNAHEIPTIFTDKPSESPTIPISGNGRSYKNTRTSIDKKVIIPLTSSSPQKNLIISTCPFENSQHLTPLPSSVDTHNAYHHKWLAGKQRKKSNWYCRFHAMDTHTRPVCSAFTEKGESLMLQRLVLHKFISATFLLLFITCTTLGDDSRKVVIVHSYEENHVCGTPQHEGIIQGLEEGGWKEGENLKVTTFYMDTKKTYTSAEQIAERGRLALSAVKDAKPDLVITIDDNAAKTVMLPLAGSDTPVVFSGMNGQPENYNKITHFMDSRKKPNSNVTGVYEKLHLNTSIKVVKAVMPDMKKVLAITDTSPTGNAITIQLEQELAQEKPIVPCEIVKVSSFEEFKELIQTKVNTDPEIGAIYSMVLSVKDAEGKTHTAPDVFRWQIANCKKPSMALNYFFAKLGLFGGAAVDFKAMGKQAGAMGAKVLNGKKAGNIPIEDARKYAIVFNTERAKDLGIQIPFEILGAADFVYDKIELK